MTKCKKCGMQVEWKTVGGKMSCYSLSGESHWDACSKKVFDDVKKHGKAITEKRGKETCHGYQSDKYGKKFYSREGTHTKGRNYKPVMHAENCNATPWEDCVCKTH